MKNTALIKKELVGRPMNLRAPLLDPHGEKIECFMQGTRLRKVHKESTVDPHKLAHLMPEMA